MALTVAGNPSSLRHMRALKEPRLLHPRNVVAVCNPVRVDGRRLREEFLQLSKSHLSRKCSYSHDRI